MLEHFYVKFGDISCSGGFRDIVRKKTDRQTDRLRQTPLKTIARD